MSGVADSVGAYTLMRVTGPEQTGAFKAKSQEAFGATTAWLNHSQRAAPHGLLWARWSPSPARRMCSPSPSGYQSLQVVFTLE